MVMTARPLALIVPTAGLPKDDSTAQCAVWSAVASLLQPDIGKKFSKFYPQLRLEKREICVPFGVTLGRANPPLFLDLYRESLDRQSDAVTYHVISMLSRLDPNHISEEDGTMICSAVVDGSDPELTFHSLWHLAVSQGDLLPDCGVYYVAQKRAFLEPKEVEQILAHPERHALCMVNLEPPEVPNHGI